MAQSKLWLAPGALPVEGRAWTRPVDVHRLVLFLNGPAPVANAQHGLPVSQPCARRTREVAGTRTTRSVIDASATIKDAMTGRHQRWTTPRFPNDPRYRRVVGGGPVGQGEIWVSRVSAGQRRPTDGTFVRIEGPRTSQGGSVHGTLSENESQPAGKK